MNKVCELLIERGQDIRKAIGDYVLEQGWEAAYVSGAVGSVQDVCLTAPKCRELPPQVNRTEVEGPGEILAFTGEVMVKDKMDPSLKSVYKDDGHPLFIHIHASLAVSGAHVYGGGLQEGKAFRLLKVYLQQVSA